MNAGGQCNYTVEPPVNPQVNTFTVTSILTTAAVRLLISCYSTTCNGGGNKRSQSLLSDMALSQREEMQRSHSSDASKKLGREALPPLFVLPS